MLPLELKPYTSIFQLLFLLIIHFGASIILKHQQVSREKENCIINVKIKLLLPKSHNKCYFNKKKNCLKMNVIHKFQCIFNHCFPILPFNDYYIHNLQNIIIVCIDNSKNSPIVKMVIW